MRQEALVCAATLMVCVLSAVEGVAQTRSSGRTYEKILIPTVAHDPIPGALGSEWVTEISGRYLGSDELVIFFPVCPPFECTYPRNPGPLFGAEFPTSPHGSVLEFHAAQARNAIVSARVRDLSRALHTWGTEIPVVRESEVGQTPITLIDLPVSDRFRTMIRMYDFDSVAGEFTVTVLPLGEDTPLTEFAVPVTELRTAGGARQGIGVAVIAGLPIPAPAPDRIRLMIRTAEPTRFWAFASITNNETQHVTIVSPARPAAEP